ncbi:hypothetical protein B5M47_03870 [candidate division CPR3 bacterium 4484_211]|uniref:AAA+ ATPase domain-containing protein n=1 Tax=candidate division CPR3 bacterium 4484_211 TaxID=1968527 RepID=A0A1W9NW66_UNCC3|nr:MAG: hypothetical protein B5M47_03870 [candidate division CPR3 bacterium 4484_211]
MNEKIAERLYFHNPWWQSGKISPKLALSFKRKLFTELWDKLSLDRILVLKGPRRTGKTTIIYQIIQQLLSQGVNPFNILYLSFDDIDLRIRLPEILKVWERESKQILEQEPLLYIFLDEVQFLDFWEIDAKLFYDKKYPIKFFASGSSATLIRKTTESLAGRTFEKVLLPLDFEEYLYLEGKSVGLTKKNLKQLKRRNINFLPFKNKLFLLWEKYLERGGFPHLVELEPEEQPQALKEDILDKVVYRDLVQLYGIKEPATLERMLRYLAGASSGILNLSNLSSNLKISWESTQNYLTYLKQAYLVFTLPKYSRSSKEMARSLEKGFVIDTGIMNLFSKPEKSALWETAVARHLWQVWSRNTYFWRDRYEVDVVFEKKGELVPVEIKSGVSISKNSLRGLVSFCKKYQIPEGFVLYSGEKKTETVQGIKLKFIPCWEYLLCHPF